MLIEEIIGKVELWKIKRGRDVENGSECIFFKRLIVGIILNRRVR